MGCSGVSAGSFSGLSSLSRSTGLVSIPLMLNVGSLCMSSSVSTTNAVNMLVFEVDFIFLQ